MSHAMNREEVIEAVYLGQGEPGQPVAARHLLLLR